MNREASFIVFRSRGYVYIGCYLQGQVFRQGVQ